LDYFFGDPIQNHTNEEGWDRPAWMAKSRKAAGESVPKWFETVKENMVSKSESQRFRFFIVLMAVFDVGPNAKYSAVGDYRTK